MHQCCLLCNQHTTGENKHKNGVLDHFLVRFFFYTLSNNVVFKPVITYFERIVTQTFFGKKYWRKLSAFSHKAKKNKHTDRTNILYIHYYTIYIFIRVSFS